MTTIVKFLLLLLLSFFSFMGFANVSEERAIEQVVTDYMESRYIGNHAQMERAIHRGITRGQNEIKDGLHLTKEMKHLELVSLTKPPVKKWLKASDEPLKLNVEILDINGNMASIKVGTDSCELYDYLHLAKVNDQWKIVNVLRDNRRAK
ncbi:nuclear transport factor 2 family protein [Ulvibacterium sp.]|uniref:nuclear transport factor 2 family protein n=1 Tax=Ulvibacterium sp. TaxID=2665914 RepID=UPI003CC50931